MSTPREGYCFIFSAPSGCGKSTVVRKLSEQDPRLVTSVSTTTRPKRSQEIDGQHYFFVSDAQFDELISNDAFVEFATVFEYRYGTRRAVITKLLEDGFDVLFDIDWQGARTIKQQDLKVVSFFLIPPSLEELERRLRERGQDSTSSVKYRMSEAMSELSHYDEFDYVIVNDSLTATCDLIQSCIAMIRSSRSLSVPPIHRTLRKLFGS